MVACTVDCSLQLNLFLAVLKTKFAKAQTAFRQRGATRRGTRRNSVMTLLGKAKNKWQAVSDRRLSTHWHVVMSPVVPASPTVFCMNKGKAQLKPTCTQHEVHIGGVLTFFASVLTPTVVI